MSVQPKFENVFPVTENRFPIVFRLEVLHPKDIWRILMHDRRRGGDLSHVDPAATPFNERLLGEPDWDLRIKSEIRAAQEGNFAEKIRALEAKSRKKEAAKVKVLGLSDPWNACSEGPLREGIITVNKDWFGGAGIAKWNKGKVAEFKARAMDFLQESFPDGQLAHLRDEADATWDACQQTWGEVAAMRDRAVEVAEKIEGATEELRLVWAEIGEESARWKRVQVEKEEAERARDKARAEALVAEGDSVKQKEMARELREKLRLVQERALEEERGWELKREGLAKAGRSGSM